MPSDWYDRWEEAGELRRQARYEREQERKRLRHDPQDPPDEADADHDEPFGDWWDRKYGPDPVDVAFEKHRATLEDQEWPDDEDSELVVVDEDADVDEARLARYDNDSSPYSGTYSEE